MKRYKIFISSILLLFMVVFLFSFSASAAYREVTLKQLVDAGSLYCSYSYEDSEPNPNETYEVDVTANTSHWAEAVRLYLPADDTYLTSLSLNILSNNNSLFSSLPSGSTFSVSTGRFCLASTDFGIIESADYSNVARLRMTFRFQLDDNTFQYVHSNWTYPFSWGNVEPSFRVPYIEFDPLNFSFDLPYNVTSLYSVNFEIDFTTNSSTPNLDCGGVSYFMVWGGKFVFNIGSLAEAPIYAGPETESYDEYHAMEDDLLGSNEANKEQVDSFLEDFNTITPPSSSRFSIIKALSFWQSVINDNINSNPIFNEIIIYVLSIGLVVFVLSTGIINSFLRSKDKEEFQQIRNEKREYFKARTEYFKSHNRRYK